MKLRAFTLLFRLAVWCEELANALARVAGRFHQWAWNKATKENLATCNDRQAKRTRFC